MNFYSNLVHNQEIFYKWTRFLAKNTQIGFFGSKVFRLLGRGVLNTSREKKIVYFSHNHGKNSKKSRTCDALCCGHTCAVKQRAAKNNTWSPMGRFYSALLDAVKQRLLKYLLKGTCCHWGTTLLQAEDNY